MGRHSIKIRIMGLFTIIIAILVALLLLFNNLISESYYLSGKRKMMTEAIASIDCIFDSYNSGDLSDTDLVDKMDQICSNINGSVIVVASDWSTIYTSEKGENEMISRLKMSIFNSDIFENKTVQPQELPTTMEDATKSPFKNKDKGSTELPEDGDFNHVIDMAQSGVYENREIITQNDEYTLQKVYDSRLEGDFYELYGTLSNGAMTLIRMPIQAIKDSMALFNTSIRYIGIGILIIGLIASYLLSVYITKPIIQLQKVAKKMSDLDFDAKYDGKDKSEIGQLGVSINEMSDALESNIAQLKAANLELQKDINRKEEIDEMRKDFISNVSHELKTPIALIQGYAEGLKEGITEDPESMDFYCEVIMDEANKMNTMVKKLLTLNQIEFGNEELVMERFDVINLINSVLSANEIRMNQQGINVTFENSGEHIDVWSDEYKIEEVITNYISNAINHCDYAKKIDVRVTKENDVVRVSVFNTGDKIPDEDLENIWIKFYKVDKARTREYGGNGIGLSIVKAIMDSYNKHCGAINHEDGVEFWFELDGSNK